MRGLFLDLLIVGGLTAQSVGVLLACGLPVMLAVTGSELLIMGVIGALKESGVPK